MVLFKVLNTVSDPILVCPLKLNILISAYISVPFHNYHVYTYIYIINII